MTVPEERSTWPKEPSETQKSGARGRASRGEGVAALPGFQAGAPGPSCSAAAAYPASVGASSPGVGELRRPDQSQDFLSPQKANHHPCLRLSNSLAGTNRSKVSPAAAGGGGAAEPVRRALPGVTPT